METILEDCRTSLVAALRHRGFLEREIEDALRAFEYSSRVHARQTRANGKPYVTHPVEVAFIYIGELEFTDIQGVLILILHDTIEDGDNPDEIFLEIQRMFGNEVAQSVVFLSKKPGEHAYLRRFRYARIREQFMKLCDRLHNMRNPNIRDLVRCERKREETRREILPIARQLIKRLPVVDRWRAEHLLRELTEHSRARR